MAEGERWREGEGMDGTVYVDRMTMRWRRSCGRFWKQTQDQLLCTFTNTISIWIHVYTYQWFADVEVIITVFIGGREAKKSYKCLKQKDLDTVQRMCIHNSCRFSLPSLPIPSFLSHHARQVADLTPHPPSPSPSPLQPRAHPNRPPPPPRPSLPPPASWHSNRLPLPVPR